jgi:membrane associated rhomboid family serine protease
VPEQINTIQANRSSSGQRSPVPIITYLVIGACVAVYIGESLNRREVYALLLYPLAQHQWWTLLTATLIHGSIMHILFNLSAFLVMGKIVELTAGRIRFAVLLILTAWISSFFQLYFDQIGIGLSGVAYGVFGFILGASPANDYYRWFVKQNATMLIGWAVLCIVLTQFKILGIANIAHFSGLIYGAICGLIYGLPRYRIAFITLSIVSLLVSFVLLPSLSAKLS